MKKVAYVCGGGGDDLADVRSGGGSGDFVDGIVPHLELSVVEESTMEGDSSSNGGGALDEPVGQQEDASAAGECETNGNDGAQGQTPATTTNATTSS